MTDVVSIHVMETLRQFYAGKSVAVLGGNGMLGSYVVDLLSECGAMAHIYDTQPWPWPTPPPANCRQFTPADCSKVSVFTDDIVINCAAKVTGITWNENHHADMAMANAGLAVAPLKACLDSKTARYVYLSTACVYPAEADVPTEEHWGWKGTPEPTNYGYGIAKRFGEQLCMLARDEHPWFKPLVLRPSNMYSPRENFGDPNAHVIPRTIYRILSGESPLRMRGTGTAMRSFLHARDAAYGVLRAAMTNHTGILNLPATHDHEVSIASLVMHIQSAVGTQVPVVFTGIGADGYQRRLSSAELLDRVLNEQGMRGGWKPATSLGEGLKETVEGCKSWMANQRLIEGHNG